MDIILKPYENELEVAVALIQGFWKEHNNQTTSIDEANNDLNEWTKSGHKFFLVDLDSKSIGFVHLGSRGYKIDWLEDIYISSEYQNKGIGTKVITMIEDIVKVYSESLYIEVSARNERAIKLYHKNGYNCLNTITIRKDFQKSQYHIIRNENIYNVKFHIKRRSD